MAISSILKIKCPVCGKTAVEVSRFNIGKSSLVKLECGHLIASEKLVSDSTDTKYLKPFPDGRKLMPYQIDGVKFAEQSDVNCLIADEQGLGKTIQALAVLSYNLEALTPAVVVTKTTLKQQWLFEIVGIVGTRKVQILKTAKDKALPGFDIYIITYDILKNAEVFEFINVKTLVLDECQAIKNHLSGRAKAVQQIVSSHNIKHIMGLSGTPIKNNAGEYFTILNLLRPSRFPEYKRYLRTYCDSYETFYGDKTGGLKDAEYFHQQTSDFIIRRTKSEVLKDLPELTRRFHHVEFDKRLSAAYASANKELEELFYAEEDENTMTNMIAVMTKMRQIAGVSKVPAVVEFVTDHLLSTDRKITIFVHHHVVNNMLEAELNTWLRDGDYLPALLLTSDMSADKRADAVQEFKDNPKRKVLIASTLAAGEGLNLQFCSDSIMMERQWNPANEEQAEARFHRYGQKNNVNVTYAIATDTIDEYFTELVEQKRAIVANTLDGKVVNWEMNSLMKELASVLVQKGGKKWRL